jgi:hypothetical protein
MAEGSVQKPRPDTMEVLKKAGMRALGGEWPLVGCTVQE